MFLACVDTFSHVNDGGVDFCEKCINLLLSFSFCSSEHLSLSYFVRVE